MSHERTEGRRASDLERKHLRKLENAVRNFIAHYEDHPEERFAPRTREMVSESRSIFKEIDELRAAGRGRPASVDSASADPS